MATSVPVVRCKQTTLDNVSWTPIVAPIDCDNAYVINVDAAGVATAVVLKLRTDDADASTEIRINPGQQYSFAGTFTAPHNTGGRFRFGIGDSVIFAKLASGSYAVPQSYF